MTWRCNYWAPVVFLAVGCAQLSAAEAIDTAAIDALAKKAIKSWRVPGVAIAIVQDNEVVYLKGHGTRRLGTTMPVTPDTLFPIASCTKAFTTTLMAVLVDEGKLGWDDPVRRHLPWFRLSDPEADRQVTLRDLVTHRTGLGGHDLLWYRSSWSQEEIIRRAGRLPLDGPFRKAFQYQSTMFTAAGLAEAAAAGEPWADLLRKRLLVPLGLRETVLTSKEAEAVSDRAGPHQTGPRGELVETPFYPMETPDPAGSVHSTARDLAKWLAFQLSDGSTGGRRIVSAKALAQTHTPQIEIPMDRLDRAMFPYTRKMSYGIGWVVMDHRGQRVWAHAGAIDGFRAQLTMLPDKGIGIVLLANRHQTKMNIALSNAIVDLVLGETGTDWNAAVQAAVRREEVEQADEDCARLARRQPGTRPSCELSAYAGDYKHPAYGTVRVSVGPTGLVWQWNDFRAALEHFHHDAFVLPIEVMGHPLVSFQLDKSGAIRSMKVEGNLNIELRRGSHRP